MFGGMIEAGRIILSHEVGLSHEEGARNVLYLCLGEDSREAGVPLLGVFAALLGVCTFSSVHWLGVFGNGRERGNGRWHTKRLVHDHSRTAGPFVEQGQCVARWQQPATVTLRTAPFLARPPALV